MATYASETSVSVQKSQAEIEKLLLLHGATKFISGWDVSASEAVISFEMNGRRIRFILALPMVDDHSFWYTPGARNRRSEKAALAAYDKAVRARWRALGLALKAKFVMVDEGLASFEDEFLAYTVLPDNSTVGDWAEDQVNQAYQSNRMPDLLPGNRPALLAP